MSVTDIGDVWSITRKKDLIKEKNNVDRVATLQIRQRRPATFTSEVKTHRLA